MGLLAMLRGKRSEPILDTDAITAELTALTELLDKKIATLRIQASEGVAAAEVYREFLELALSCRERIKRCISLTAILLPPRNHTRAKLLTGNITSSIASAKKAVKECGVAFSFLTDAEKALILAEQALQEFSELV